MKVRSGGQFVSRQSGLSLIELMIALVVGAILIGGVMQVFLSNRASFMMERGLSDVQENGRFALGFMATKIRMAGYTGCSGGKVTNTLNEVSGTNIYDFEQGITGHEATSPTSSTWTPGLDSELSTAHAPVPGSDVLTVRTTSGGMVQLTKKMNNNAASLHIEENSGINEGDILIISDCTNSSIFQVTNAEPDTSGTVVHNTGAASPGNSQKYLGKSFAKGAELQKLTTINYFVSPSEDDAKDCSEGCSLWRQVGDDDAEELVSGVENMQLLFGTDTDTDNSVDRYLTAEEVESLSLWSDVKSIRISLLLRSIDSALANLPAPSSQTLARRKVFPDPPDDQRLRRVFTTTIAIRNRVL